MVGEERRAGNSKPRKKGAVKMHEERMSGGQGVRAQVEADEGSRAAGWGGGLEGRSRTVNFCLWQHEGWHGECWGGKWPKESGDRLHARRLGELVFNLVLVDLCFKGIQVPIPLLFLKLFIHYQPQSILILH